jgi:hypothetical protein
VGRMPGCASAVWLHLLFLLTRQFLSSFREMGLSISLSCRDEIFLNSIFLSSNKV